MIIGCRDECVLQARRKKRDKRTKTVTKISEIPGGGGGGFCVLREFFPPLHFLSSSFFTSGRSRIVPAGGNGCCSVSQLFEGLLSTRCATHIIIIIIVHRGVRGDFPLG